MEFLISPGPYQTITLVIVVMLVVTCLLCLFLVLNRSYQNLLKSYQSRHLVRDEEVVLQFLESGDPELLAQTTVNTALRDLMISLASNIVGSDREKIMLAYTFLGFTQRDFKLLQSNNLREQAESLARCRNLMVPIPSDGWQYLLNHRLLVFRWAVLEYLVAHLGSKALPQVMAFFAATQNRHRGVNLHLLACLAKTDPDLIVFLMSHTTSDQLVELCLQTLAIYPLPQAESAIMSHLRMDASDEVVIAATKALGVYPTEACLAVFIQLSEHQHWVVRMQVARNLAAYDLQDCASTLDNLLTDQSYYVRMAAVQTVMTLQPATDTMLGDVLQTPEHPSYSLVMQELEEVA